MPHVVLVAVLLLTPVQPNWAKNGVVVSPTVDSIGLDTRFADIVRRLGKPLRTTAIAPSEVDGVVGGKELYYRSLIVEVFQGERDSEPRVASIRITGTHRVVSNGVRLGLSLSEVRSMLGNPERTDGPDRNGKEWWWYILAGQDAWFRVQFTNGLVSSIEWRQDWS